MKGITWEGILTGIIVVVILVGVSILTLTYMPKDIRAWFSLQPTLGTPVTQTPIQSFEDAPPGESYTVAAIDCGTFGGTNEKDCRKKGFSPNSICNTVWGSDYNAFAVNCELVDLLVPPTNYPEVTKTGLRGSWDSTSNNGWCQDTTGYDMAVTCTTLPTDDLVTHIVDCHGPCSKSSLTPDTICGNGYHALKVDCESIGTANGVGSDRSFSDDWGTANNAWCQDTPSPSYDMTVTCAPNTDTNFPKGGAANDLFLSVIYFSNGADPRTNWGYNPDSYCQTHFGHQYGGNWKALDIDFYEIDFINGGGGSGTDGIKRDFTQTWSQATDSNGIDESLYGWAQNDKQHTEPMTVTCYKVPSPVATCNDHKSNNNNGYCDYAGCCFDHSAPPKYVSMTQAACTGAGYQWDPPSACCQNNQNQDESGKCCDGLDNPNSPVNLCDNGCCENAGVPVWTDMYNSQQCVNHGYTWLNPDPSCFIDPTKPATYNPHRDETNPTCDDKIDNNNDGFCDWNGCCYDISVNPAVPVPGLTTKATCTAALHQWRTADPSCFSGACSVGNPIYSKTQSEVPENKPALPTFSSSTNPMMVSTLVHDCWSKGTGNCYSTNADRPNYINITQFCNPQSPLGVNCENIGFSTLADHSTCSQSNNGCQRKFLRQWQDGTTAWCQDTGSYDMAVTCVHACTPYKLASIEETIITCTGNGGCYEQLGEPETICNSIGSGWHALAVDCENIQWDGGSSGTHTELLTDAWSAGNKKGWCQKNGGDENMALICTNATSADPTAGNVKVVIADCSQINGATSCQNTGISPDMWCNDHAGTGWKAIFVDCESIGMHQSGTNPDYIINGFGDPWTSDSNGWCENGGQAMTVTCVSPSFSMYNA